MTYLNALLQKDPQELDTGDKNLLGQDETTARDIANFLLQHLPGEFKNCLGCPKALNMERLDKFYDEVTDATENQLACEDITCQQFLTWIYANYEYEYRELVKFASVKENIAYE